MKKEKIKKKAKRKKEEKKAKVKKEKNQKKLPGKRFVKTWETKRTKKKKTKFLTGVNGMDNLIGGGIPFNSTFLVYGHPHCGKKPILMQIGYSLARKKQPVVLVITDFGIKRWKEMMESSKWNIEKSPYVYFIDCYSQQFATTPDEENIKYIPVPYTLSSFSIACSDFINSSFQKFGKKPVLILHSLSTLIQVFGEEETFKFLQFFVGKLRNEEVTSIFTLQSGMHSENTINAILSLMDGIVEMKDGQIQARGFRDIKIKEWVKYKVTNNGVVVLS